jgi:TorA maturation chaperone TorD
MADENTLWRAQAYALLATLLASAPEQTLLDNLAAIEVTEPESPMGKLWLQLTTVAKNVDVSAVYDEYQQLFIGVTHGELIPYGSYYQTGFLMEEPLAELRTDLARLGLEKQDDTSEPEDHAAAQCDVMRLLLMAEGTPIVTAEDFFKHHLNPWMEHFFADMAKAKQAVFYQAIGQFGMGFIKLESAIFR